ncbi:hypothetical protein JCM33774_29030 [Actinophytocola sp. KF-1]
MVRPTERPRSTTTWTSVSTGSASRSSQKVRAKGTATRNTPARINRAWSGAPARAGASASISAVTARPDNTMAVAATAGTTNSPTIRHSRSNSSNLDSTTGSRVTSARATRTMAMTSSG